MNSLGMKWDGAALEVGFTAGDRAEFDAHVRKLTAMADMVWPEELRTPDLSRDPAHVDSGDFHSPGPLQRQSENESLRYWREKQGLA
jgi:hypothetical protein